MEGVVGSAFMFKEDRIKFIKGSFKRERMTKKVYILKFVSKGATEGSCVLCLRGSCLCGIEPLSHC